MKLRFALNKSSSGLCFLMFRVSQRLRRYFELNGQYCINEKTFYFQPENRIEYSRYLGLLKKEPATISWIENAIRPNDVFFDIGANVGVFGIYAAACQTTATVVSFEPHKPTFVTLLKNIRLNGQIGRNIPVSIPLAGSTQLGVLGYKSNLSGRSGSQFGSASHPQNVTEVVSAQSVDNLIEAELVPHPDLVKIDVDGLEFEILKGMEQTLVDKNRPREVQVEINPGEEKHIEALMSRCGYKASSDHFPTHCANLIAGGKPRELVHFNRIYYAPK